MGAQQSSQLRCRFVKLMHGGDEEDVRPRVRAKTCDPRARDAARLCFPCDSALSETLHTAFNLQSFTHCRRAPGASVTSSICQTASAKLYLPTVLTP